MELVFEHPVAAPRAEVCEFHLTPHNLEVLLADWAPFRLLHAGERVEVGGELWLEELALGCLPVVLGYRHVQLEPPDRFADALIHGPFERFDHLHEFVDDGRGGTLVRDRLCVRLPWSFGGERMVRRLVAPRLAEVFALRGAALGDLARAGRFGAGAASTGASAAQRSLAAGPVPRWK